MKFAVTLFEKHILSFSKPACCEDLAWRNLKGLAELDILQYSRVVITKNYDGPTRQFSKTAHFQIKKSLTPDLKKHHGREHS